MKTKTLYVRRLTFLLVFVAISSVLIRWVAAKTTPRFIIRRIYQGGVTDLHFTASGTLVVTGWDTINGKQSVVQTNVSGSDLLRDTPRFKGRSLPQLVSIHDALLLPDGKTFAQIIYSPSSKSTNASPQDTAHPAQYELLSTADNKLLWSKREMGDGTGDIVVSARGARVAVGTLDGEVLLLHSTAGLWQASSLIRPVLKDSNFYASPAVRAIEFSHDGRLLMTCSGQGAVRFWNAASGKLMRTLSIPSFVEQKGKTRFYRAHLSPDTKLVVTSSSKADLDDFEDLYVRWVSSRKTRRLSGFPAGTYVSCFAFSPDSRLLAAGVRRADNAMSIALWDTHTGKKIRTVNIPSKLRSYKGITALAWSKNGNTLISGDSNGYMARWRIK